MSDPIAVVRVNERGRTQLLTLKRRTGVQRWNVLCRWALAVSIRDQTPAPSAEGAPSSVEMNWSTFGGDAPSIWLALVKVQAKREQLDPTSPEVLRDVLNRHLHRGIGSLVGTVKSGMGVERLLSLVAVEGVAR